MNMSYSLNSVCPKLILNFLVFHKNQSSNFQGFTVYANDTTFHKCLTLYPLASSADNFCKQFGPRSALTERGPDLDPNCLTF